MSSTPQVSVVGHAEGGGEVEGLEGPSSEAFELRDKSVRRHSVSCFTGHKDGVEAYTKDTGGLFGARVRGVLAESHEFAPQPPCFLLSSESSVRWAVLVSGGDHGGQDSLIGGALDDAASARGPGAEVVVEQV